MTEEIKNTPVDQTEQPKTVETPESDQDRNWKKFREAKEAEKVAAKKALDEQIRINVEEKARAEAFQKALEAAVNKPQQQPEDETEDQRMERKLQAMLEKRLADEERRRQDLEFQQYPQKLRSSHPDFDQVCSDNNLDYLEFHHPELASALGKRPDSYDKWADIYKAVKRYIPNTNVANQQKKAEANMAKPQAFNAGMTTPGDKVPAIRLDEARKAANWERMQKQLRSMN